MPGLSRALAVACLLICISQPAAAFKEHEFKVRHRCTGERAARAGCG
jgi:hypothetical protein